MDKYNFSPTSEISDFSNSESDVSSLSSFFNGGKNRNRNRNTKKYSNVVSKKKTKFPPNMNRWLAWSLVSVSTIWILSSEIKDRGIFRSLIRWFQNKPLSQTDVAVAKIEKVFKTMIENNVPLKHPSVNFPDSKKLDTLHNGNIYAEHYEHRVEIKNIDMEYKRFYYNVPFCKEKKVAVVGPPPVASVPMSLQEMINENLIKYYQKICKLTINFKNGVDDSNKDKVKKAIRDKLKFKYSTRMRQVKNNDLSKNNLSSSPHLEENKGNHDPYNLPNNFIHVSPLNHKHKLFQTSKNTKQKIYPENKAHELINDITPITINNAKLITNAKEHAAKGTNGIAKNAKSTLDATNGYFKVQQHGNDITADDFKLHHDATFTGGTFVNNDGKDYDIEGEENSKITKDNMEMDILLSLLNNQMNETGNLFTDGNELNNPNSLRNIETPLLSYLQSYSAAICKGDLERFHPQYNNVGITKCLHFVLTLKPDFTDVIEHLKTEQINLVLPKSEEMDNNIAIKIISSVYDDVQQFKNDPNNARIHNSISFHHPNTIGNFMENNANSRKAFVIPQKASAKMVESLNTSKTAYLEEIGKAAGGANTISTATHPGAAKIGGDAAKLSAQNYIRAYYQVPPDTLWSEELKDKIPEKYTKELTNAYRFLEDLVNTGTKGSLMVDDTVDDADSNVNKYKTIDLLAGNNSLRPFGAKNNDNNHRTIWNESYELTNVPLRGNLLRSTYHENRTENNTPANENTVPAEFSFTGGELTQIQNGVGHFNQDYNGGNNLHQRVEGMLDAMTTNARKIDNGNKKYITLYKYGRTGNTPENKLLRQMLLSTNTAVDGERQSVIRVYERLYERIYFMCGNSIMFMDNHEHTLHPADVFAIGDRLQEGDATSDAHKNYLGENPIQKAVEKLQIHPHDMVRDYDLRNYIQTQGIHRFRLLNDDDYDQQIAMIEEGATDKNISGKSEKIKNQQKLLEDFLKSEVKYGEFKISS